MKPRLIILVVFALGMAFYWANRTATPQVVDIADVDREQNRSVEELPLKQRPLAGEEPDIPAELSITYHVDGSGKKNRIHYSIDEANGFYVEYFELQVWYKETPDMLYDDSPVQLVQFVNDYVPANGTLTNCLEIVPGELDNTPDNSMGTAHDWEIAIVDWGRTRAQNPDPLPQLTRIHNCDD